MTKEKTEREKETHSTEKENNYVFVRAREKSSPLLSKQYRVPRNNCQPKIPKKNIIDRLRYIFPTYSTPMCCCTPQFIFFLSRLPKCQHFFHTHTPRTFSRSDHSKIHFTLEHSGEMHVAYMNRQKKRQQCRTVHI